MFKFDLSPYVNIHELEACHLEICAGIARSKTNMASRVIPHYEMQGDLQKLMAYKSGEGARIANVADENEKILNAEELKFYKSLTHEQKKRFLQLYKKAYWDGEFVRLKFTKPEHSQEKFATFYDNKCEWHANAEFFPQTKKFIETLPFIEIGRILIFISYHYLASDVHYDRRDEWYDGQHHFIWMNPFGNKKFFMLNDAGQKTYLTDKVSFFDVSCLHGAEPAEQMTYTLRVDGQLHQDFCNKVGIRWQQRM